MEIKALSDVLEKVQCGGILTPAGLIRNPGNDGRVLRLTPGLTLDPWKTPVSSHGRMEHDAAFHKGLVLCGKVVNRTALTANSVPDEMIDHGNTLILIGQFLFVFFVGFYPQYFLSSSF